jgi:hypothetical protein
MAVRQLASSATTTVLSPGPPATGAVIGPVIAAGLITLANEAVFAPIASGGKITDQFNWRIIPATAAAALALAGLEKLAPQFAKGIAYLTLATVLFVKTGKAPSPIQNISTVLGYKT